MMKNAAAESLTETLIFRTGVIIKYPGVCCVDFVLKDRQMVASVCIQQGCENSLRCMQVLRPSIYCTRQSSDSMALKLLALASKMYDACTGSLIQLCSGSCLMAKVPAQ